MAHISRKANSMLYVRKTAPVNSNGSSVIRGRGLARRKLNAAQKARLAADLVSGELRLEPSLQQAAELVRVPQAKIRHELKARIAARETEKDLPVTNLVEAWMAASEEERAAAIREIGPAEVWDRLANVVS